MSARLLTFVCLGHFGDRWMYVPGHLVNIGIFMYSCHRNSSIKNSVDLICLILGLLIWKTGLVLLQCYSGRLLIMMIIIYRTFCRDNSQFAMKQKQQHFFPNLLCDIVLSLCVRQVFVHALCPSMGQSVQHNKFFWTMIIQSLQSFVYTYVHHFREVENMKSSQINDGWCMIRIAHWDLWLCVC